MTIPAMSRDGARTSQEGAGQPDGHHADGMFGYSARLVIDLPGGPHDITSLVRQVIENEPQRRVGWWIDAGALASEITIENRARQRAHDRTRDPA